jgi:prepilin-type N-terminal cleavage/methylation domain-containing protein
VALPHFNRRCGMTLVELLVVVAILGLLSVVVLPNLSNPGDARKAREAARAVSGFIANVQSRAIGTRGGGGLWLEPLANPITDAAGVSHVVAIDLFAAQIPEPYAGEALNSTVLVTPLGASANLSFQNGFQLPNNLTSSPNLAIRFANSSALFRLSSVSGNSAVAATDASRNQTLYNTPWPVADVNGISYELFLPATKDPAVSLTLGNGMAIDLSWTQLGSSGPPSNTQPSQVLYDSSGRPSSVVRSLGQSEPIVDPVCLLVAPLKMIQDGTCFTKPGAYWVAIDPRGGVPRVAEVMLLSGASLDSNNRPANSAAVIGSQLYVRQSTFQEGR